MTTRQNVREAFRELRKNGYFARMNFWCCQSCAWSDVPEDKEDTVVFFHNQDEENLERDGYCYLAWSGDGRFIVDVLEKHDIEIEWDGDDDKRIKMCGFTPKRRRWGR